jgi:hypothetical protein
MEGGKTDDLWERVLYRLPQERRAAAASVPPRPKRHGLMFVPAAAAIAVVLILMFSGDGTRRRNGTPSQLDAVRSKIPLVKPTDHGVTVLTFQTDDPRVTIAWFFEEEPTEEEEN